MAATDRRRRTLEIADGFQTAQSCALRTAVRSCRSPIPDRTLTLFGADAARGQNPFRRA